MYGVTVAQVTLEATLMMYVLVELGVAHQGGALTLWTCGLWLVHTLNMFDEGISSFFLFHVVGRYDNIVVRLRDGIYILVK